MGNTNTKKEQSKNKDSEAKYVEPHTASNEQKVPEDAIGKNEALLQACKTGNISYAKLLLAAGANASYYKQEEGTWGARDKEAPLHCALRSRNLELIDMLLDNNANPNAIYENYDWRGCGETKTAFQMACATPTVLSNPTILSKFIKNGADVNQQIKDASHTMRYDGNKLASPLHLAIKHTNVEVTKMLLEAGAAVNALSVERGQSEYGTGEDTQETALHMACMLTPSPSTLALVELLVLFGANINLSRKFLINEPLELIQTVTDPRDPAYRSPYRQVRTAATPLHLAIKQGNAQVVKLLVLVGADQSIPYKYGDFPQPIASLEASKEVKQALENDWKPEYHRYYTKSVKDAVLSLLIISKRENWKLDAGILHRIIALVASGWYEHAVKPQKLPPMDAAANERFLLLGSRLSD